MPGKKSGLGKGLDSLIPNKKNDISDSKVEKKQEKENDSPKSGEIMVRINEVEPNRDQPRKDFDEDALLEIAHRAVEKKTGARALRSILEETMLDIMYQIPKDDMIGHVTITQDYVKGVGGPRIEVRD